MFVPSKQGHPKLLLNGYIYTKQEDTPSHIVWRCTNRTACKSRLWHYTTFPHHVVIRKPHSHPPDWERFQEAIQKLSWKQLQQE